MLRFLNTVGIKRENPVKNFIETFILDEKEKCENIKDAENKTEYASVENPLNMH